MDRVPHRPLLTRLPRASVWLVLGLFAAAAVGCPHRSPLWSPDGSRILLLAGAKGEDVDKAASRLWLVDVESSKGKRLEAPEPRVRYLAAAWIDNDSFVVFTGKWDSGSIESGSEKAWRVRAASAADRGAWEALAVPPPSESRAPMRPPAVVGGSAPVLVYPSGEEAVVALDLASRKTLLELAPAELVGPGPRGGFLVQEPEAGDTGGLELAAYEVSGKEIWRVKFSRLRDEIAAKLGKKPVEVIFNDTSTSHLPFPADSRGGDGAARERQWVGATLVFSHVGWKEGVPGYYVRLDAASGKLLDAVHGTGLWGRPASAGGVLRAIAAPVSKEKLPARVQSLLLASGKETESAALADGGAGGGAGDGSEHAVAGYAFDPEGKRFAVALGDAPVLLLYGSGSLATPRAIRLE
jgi:hypothetical protein